MQKANLPSVGASSQDGSSSLPKVSFGISISGHQKESFVSIIGYCNNVGLSMDREHKMNMYRPMVTSVDLCSILAFVSTSILPNCA